MHDTDEHYFDVRQARDRRMEYIQKKTAFHIHTHDRRMEYVRKTLSRRHFNKLEAMQSRHHMKVPIKSLYQVKNVLS